MKKGRIGALIGLFAVVLIVVGVLVWPEPKEAMAANTTFQVNVVFDDPEMDPEDIFFTVRTYSDADRLNLIQQEPLEYIGLDGLGRGKYRDTFLADTRGIYWSVFATFEANYAIDEGNPFLVEDLVENQGWNQIQLTAIVVEVRGE